jgi:early secretory antigenic target protein ESAT-6
MNDGVLVVNFAKLEQAKLDIGKALSKIETDLTELDGLGNQLKAKWGGEAQLAFAAKQKRWTDAATHLSGILNDIRRALEGSTEEYLSTEKKATSLFQ